MTDLIQREDIIKDLSRKKRVEETIKFGLRAVGRIKFQVCLLAKGRSLSGAQRPRLQAHSGIDIYEQGGVLEAPKRGDPKFECWGNVALEADG